MTCLSCPDLICLDATDDYTADSQPEGSEHLAGHLKRPSAERGLSFGVGTDLIDDLSELP